MPYSDRPAYNEPTYTPSAAYDPYPDNEEGWRELYNFRSDMFLQAVYSPGQQRAEHLFRAFDESGNEIDQTRRLFSYYAFIANTDARCLTGGRLTLEADTPAALKAGEAVWARSRMAAQVPMWSRLLCALGDYGIEVVRRGPNDVYLRAHDPRTFTLTYDVAGLNLERVVIEADYYDEPVGSQGLRMAHKRYKRVLTAEDVTVYRDGVRVPEESGRHTAKVVPFVHLRCLPWDAPEHSLPAAHGVERAIMRLDAQATQIGAITTRFANPLLAIFGAKLGANSNVAQFGRFVDGMPADGRLEYLEAKFSSIPSVLDTMRFINSQVRDMNPEFLFASDAAQESGEARSMRGQALTSKIMEMRGSVFASLAEATEIGVAMTEGRAFDLGSIPYRIDAPPVLPVNAAKEVVAINAIAEMTRADRVRHWQRLGYVDANQDPDLYANEVADETAARAQAFFTDVPVPSGGRAASTEPVK